MKKITGFLILLLFAVSLTNCKKDDKKTNSSQTTNPPEESYEIEYRFTTDEPGTALSVQYRNEDAELESESLGGSLTNWTKSFTRTGKPFESYIKVNFFNSNSFSSGFAIYIYVDDQLVNYITSVIPGNSSYTSNVEFLVE